MAWQYPAHVSSANEHGIGSPARQATRGWVARILPYASPLEAPPAAPSSAGHCRAGRRCGCTVEARGTVPMQVSLDATSACRRELDLGPRGIPRSIRPRSIRVAYHGLCLGEGDASTALHDNTPNPPVTAAGYGGAALRNLRVQVVVTCMCCRQYCYTFSLAFGALLWQLPH
eukprot:363857-Chlamydomonas_euryale.AAC.10